MNQSCFASSSVLALVLVSCSHGGGTPEPPHPPEQYRCLGGSWLVEGQVVEVFDGVYESIGLESRTLDVTAIEEAFAVGVPAFDVSASGLNVPQYAFGLTVAPTNGTLYLGGVYYDASTNLSFDVDGQTLQFGCSQFQVLLSWSAYDGDMLVEVEIEPGVFSWDIDPTATRAGSGTFLLSGSK